MSSNFFLADRIKELSRVEGRVNITLDGVVDGFSSFGDFYASGDTVFYAITDNTQYEVGSGMYIPDGATNRALTRNVLRSSDINSGPYHLYGSGAGTHAGQEGYFYPMWLTKSSALSGVGVSDGPYSSAHEHVFSGYPGVTFYMPGAHMMHGLSHSVANKATAATSGSDYAVASRPVDFSTGTKEVFVTYPGARSVVNTYGAESDVREPKESGLAIWKNGSVISYSPDLVWDDTNSHLGINKDAPAFAIDVGGLKSFSQIRASGFIDGGSGILFSGVDGQFSGGRQLEPFLRNEVGDTANGVVKLSGTVDEYIGFESQAPMLVFAGPASDCGCVDAIPTFRALTAGDMPLDGLDGLDHRFVKQNNDGLGTASEYPYQNGMVALYAGSGEITYDSGIVYNATYNRLGLGWGTNGTAIIPEVTLDVSGNMAANSGYFDQLLFTDNIIKIGHNTGDDKNNLFHNYYTVNIGYSAGYGSSGNFDTVFIGHSGGLNTHRASGSLFFGVRAGEGSVSGVESVIIGNSSASDASGINNSVMIGKYAGKDANRISTTVAIGDYAAYGAGTTLSDSFAHNVAIGSLTLSNAPLATDISAIGYRAMADSSGVSRSVAVGPEASRHLYSSTDVVSIGSGNLGFASGVHVVDSMGKEALVRASGGIYRTVAIGYQAGYEAWRVHDSVFLGHAAGQEVSGSYNTYIGRNAGIKVSGHNNIEIIPSGGNSSILTHTASNRINIANTIVGTANSNATPFTTNFSNVGVGIGYMEDADPPSTLYVRPSGREDHPFIIRHQGSGGKAPYVALQSGDATTFFHITNSGSVITSGYMTPSGGLNLPDIPKEQVMINSGVGGYMLWNDGGTLTWNGAGVGGAGSYSNWKLTTGAVADDAITDGQTVIISGVSGVETQLDGSNNFLRVSASGLSGVLQDQIDTLSASNYNFFHANIGPGRAGGPGNVVTQDGAGKYDFTRAQLSEIPDEGAIAFSGVNGITVDLTKLTGDGYTSGIYEIGWDASSSYGWNVIASGETAAGGRNTINAVPDGTGVAFSGIKGVEFALWDNSDGQFVLIADPNVLSGVLYDTTISSGNYIWSDHIDWRASGIAVSGLAVSNYNAIQGITTKSTASGITITNDKYVLDSGNGGQLSFLRLTDIKADETDATDTFAASSGNILITDQSGINKIPRRGSNVFTTAVGPMVGEAASGHNSTVMIGHLAGGNSQANQAVPAENGGHSVFIGRKAGHRLDSTAKNFDNAHGGALMTLSDGTLNNNILIGPEAGNAASGVAHSVGMGLSALSQSKRQLYPIAIGVRASEKSWTSTNSIAIGRDANSNSYSDNGGVYIGYFSHASSQESIANVAIGTSTLGESSGVEYSVAIGHGAMYAASGTNSLNALSIVAVGNAAGQRSHSQNNGVFIGERAAYKASGVPNSVFIGNQAGQSSSHANSIIISNKDMNINGDHPDYTPYQIDWAHHTEDYVIDIAHGIQGKVKTGPHAYRDGGLNTYFTDDHDVRLHIGPCVAKAEKDAGHKLTEKTVEIQPTDTADAVLTLDQPLHPNHPVPNTREHVGRREKGTYSPGGPLMQVTTDTIQDRENRFADSERRDNYGSGPNGTTLDIINRHGFPVMPIFGHWDPNTGNLHTGTSLTTTKTLLSGDEIDSVIPRYPGAYAVGFDDLACGGNTHNQWWLAVCVKYEGDDGASNPVVVNDTSSSEHGLVWQFARLAMWDVARECS